MPAASLTTRGRLVAVQAPIYAQARELRSAILEQRDEQKQTRKRVRAVAHDAERVIRGAKAVARQEGKAARLQRDESGMSM